MSELLEHEGEEVGHAAGDMHEGTLLAQRQARGDGKCQAEGLDKQSPWTQESIENVAT